MFPLRDNLVSKETPFVTFTLIGLNVLIYLWDRGWAVLGPGYLFADLAMRPEAIVQALKSGQTGPLETLFTCMFLHGNLAHLLGNMIFLLVFGPNVEHALGGLRFAGLYLVWGVAASAAHIFVDPTSVTQTLGASGAIGGVLGAYLMLFPGSQITLWIYFYETVVAAWILLGLWFIWQILLPQEGVANWAHAGGFFAGMVTILLLGGRGRLLKNVTLERDPYAEYV
ncbi:MAG TPA: rhomboid family intramembrane serine protease [Fimbriimonadaceae bacterium]|nr:rhomboid family intramembrane serine protease [Fimbriimonadaceae bacterium]HRJ96483.1 rhomboid family intramembrane serine protease [Fimbriimonadaceae bacterium]